MKAIRRRRRWPWLLLVLVSLGLAFLGVAGGAAKATADASAQAAQLSGEGEFAAAIDLDDIIAMRTGPLFVLARSTVSAAPLAAQRVLLAWAAALERQGKIDQAVAVAAGVTDPHLLATAAAERASILLDAARSAAATGEFATAISRLAQVESIQPAVTSAASTATRLLPHYQVGWASALTAAGRGVDAVSLLDLATQEGDGGEAAAVYPAALWAAAQEQLTQMSDREAVATLNRLIAQFGGSAQAAQAQQQLSTPQPVTGTLVDRSGQPVSGQVRLSSHFFTVPGGYYTTGPFYYSSANATGTFRFDSVPVGGPYVLEVFRDGDWTTYVDPATGQPANPVTVTSLTPVDLTFVEIS